MKKVVIFGATGSIGAYLTDYCVSHLDPEEFEIIAVGRRKTQYFTKHGITYVSMDMCNAEDYTKLPDEIYAVIHTAGLMPAHVTHYDPVRYGEVNVVGGMRVLEYARKAHADRILFTQTWADQAGYWDHQEVLHPYDERRLAFTGDHAVYAITKSLIVDMMENYHQEYGIRNFVFRLPNVYMYHPDAYYYVDCEKKAVGYRRMIEMAMSGKNMELWGDPDAFKDILYVKDLCQMMCKALLTDADGGIYNAGTGRRTTLREQIEGIVEVFAPEGTHPKITEVPMDAPFTSFVMDIENARRDLGYEPEYSYLDYLKDYKKEMEEKRFDALWLNQE